MAGIVGLSSIMTTLVRLDIPRPTDLSPQSESGDVTKTINLQSNTTLIRDRFTVAGLSSIEISLTAGAEGDTPGLDPLGAQVDMFTLHGLYASSVLPLSNLLSIGGTISGAGGHPSGLFLTATSGIIVRESLMMISDSGWNTANAGVLRVSNPNALAQSIDLIMIGVIN